MPVSLKKAEQLARITTLGSLAFMIGWGLVSVVAEIRPFWIDEWRVIYNLKFKDAHALWGQLDFLQQFPRCYLEIIKAFTSCFDYSYFSLRLPSFIAGTLTILVCYDLMNRIYSRDRINRFLFVMILVSASTFTGYYVQIKQYSMDLLLCLIALWQLLELLKVNSMQPLRRGSYVLLCASLLVAPFFSYTYPITIAPVFFIQVTHSISGIHNRVVSRREWKLLFLQLFPLFLSAAGIIVFYVTDAAQLMADKPMHHFWAHLMMDDGFSAKVFFYGFYNLFAEIGSGIFYWCVFGVLGTLSFFTGTWAILKGLREKKFRDYDPVLLYSSLLLLTVFGLFFAGMLPLGEPRLNAFAIPSVSVLIIRFLEQLNKNSIERSISRSLSVLIYVGVTGNIFTTFYASVTGPDYDKKMAIYRTTQEAIRWAETNRMPIFVTPDVAWPYDRTQNLPFNTTVPGDWVLKTFPAYHVTAAIPVYSIPDIATISEEIKRLPPDVKMVLAGAGSSFRVVIR